jgi:hypothetical protein
MSFKGVVVRQIRKIPQLSILEVRMFYDPRISKEFLEDPTFD